MRLHSFVFVTGAAVMATEMCASRFLAPWFGTSTMVWAVLIAVVLAAMSAGYWLGGRLADRRPSLATMHLLPLASGVLIALIPLTGGALLSGMTAGIRSTPVNVVLFSFLGVLAVFVPPVLCLAAVSPFAVRLAASPGRTGRAAGSLYAASTLGSIAGTLIPALVTIPLLGTRATLAGASAMLILTGLSGILRRAPAAVLLLLVPPAALAAASGPVRGGATVVEEDETPYQYLQVQRRTDGTVYLVVNEGGGTQSLAREGDALMPAFSYYESYLLLPLMLSGHRDPDVLVIGAGAGTIPHWLAVYVRPSMPGLSTDAVEIDGAAVEMGRRWFHLEPGDADVTIMDGRAFLGSGSGPWDIVISDTYSSQVYIPFHLATREYFELIRGVLRPGGIMALNVNALDMDSPLLQSIARTVSEVFPHTYVAHVSDDLNYMVIASDTELAPPDPEEVAARIPALLETATLFEPLMREFVPTGGMVLTDDRAPVEFMTDMMILGEALPSGRDG